MRDPSSLAFSIPNYFVRPVWFGVLKHRPALIEVWHRDPRKNGSDDSCDWFGGQLTAQEEAFAASLIDHETDNLRGFFPPAISAGEAQWRVKRIIECYKRTKRRWWQHPKWHVWHWRIYIIPFQNLRRWLLDRCCRCGERFAWAESPVTDMWNLPRVRWHKSHPRVWHMRCCEESERVRDVTAHTLQ